MVRASAALAAALLFSLTSPALFYYIVVLSYEGSEAYFTTNLDLNGSSVFSTSPDCSSPVPTLHDVFNDTHLFLVYSDVRRLYLCSGVACNCQPPAAASLPGSNFTATNVNVSITENAVVLSMNVTRDTKEDSDSTISKGDSDYVSYTAPEGYVLGAVVSVEGLRPFNATVDLIEGGGTSSVAGEAQPYKLYTVSGSGSLRSDGERDVILDVGEPVDVEEGVVDITYYLLFFTSWVEVRIYGDGELLVDKIYTDGSGSDRLYIPPGLYSTLEIEMSTDGRARVYYDYEIDLQSYLLNVTVLPAALDSEAGLSVRYNVSFTHRLNTTFIYGEVEPVEGNVTLNATGLVVIDMVSGLDSGEELVIDYPNSSIGITNDTVLLEACGKENRVGNSGGRYYLGPDLAAHGDAIVECGDDAVTPNETVIRFIVTAPFSGVYNVTLRVRVYDAGRASARIIGPYSLTSYFALVKAGAQGAVLAASLLAAYALITGSTVGALLSSMMYGVGALLSYHTGLAGIARYSIVMSTLTPLLYMLFRKKLVRYLR